MKIYKIASPLPFGTIPVSEGETQVDQVLDEWTIQQLDEKYGFKNHLGGGCWGVAFSTFDDKVVKITTDPHEVALAKDLIGDGWQVHAPFARVYEVEEMGENLYVIVKERLTPLNEDEQGLWSIFGDEYEGDIDKVPEDHEYYQVFEKFSDYTYDVSNYMYRDVFNDGNIGWDKEGNLKCFDPQSSTPGVFANGDVLKIASVEVGNLFSNCCYAPDDFIDGTAPFKGLYSDIDMCPLCKKDCEFIQEATKAELAKELGL